MQIDRDLKSSAGATTTVLDSTSGTNSAVDGGASTAVNHPGEVLIYRTPGHERCESDS